MQINIPKILDLENCLSLSSDLIRIDNSDIYEFDFSMLRWTPPFSMLYFSAQLRHFRNNHPNSICKALNYNSNSYAAHMGFYKAFGLDVGNDLGEAPGSDTYLPITEIRCDEIRNVIIPLT